MNLDLRPLIVCNDRSTYVRELLGSNWVLIAYGDWDIVTEVFCTFHRSGTVLIVPYGTDIKHIFPALVVREDDEETWNEIRGFILTKMAVAVQLPKETPQ